jgi:uncharacterized membrane protein
MNMTKRFFELDLLRGGAVILMVLFHIGYDLAHFGYASYVTTRDIEWITFRGIVLSLFLLAVGMSAYLAYSDGIKYSKLIKTLAKLILISVLISVGSYLAFPQNWIYFGVIHFIAVALVVSLVFVRFSKLSLVAGVMIIGSYLMGYSPFDPIFTYSVVHWGIPSYTVDVVSFTPWFGVVLIGIFVMDKKIFGLKIQQKKTTRSVAFLGRHSLAIYLLHQPVLFGLFYIIKLLG